MQRSRSPIRNKDLGPQCLSCRKRRVKCDSTTPLCRRCPRDDIDCPGYEKPMKFVLCQPSHSQRKTQRHSNGHGPLQEETRTKYYVSLENVEQAIAICRPPSNDKDELTLLDSIQWYNHRFIPVAQASLPLSNWNRVQDDVPWHFVPSIIKHMFIVTTRSLFAAQNGIDPLSRSEICHYRGLSLQQLPQYLSTAVEDPFGIALGTILMLMAVDMFSTIKGSWSLHFNAARRIIIQRGGIQTCLTSLPNTKEALVNYILVDIFSATTCKSTLLFSDQQAMREHSDYNSLLSELERYVLEHSCACPLPILQAITRTNLLRSTSQIAERSQEFAEDHGTTSISDEYNDIFDLISKFDPNAWAAQVLQFGRTLPQKPEDTLSMASISALASRGLRYQAGALLYLILSSAHAYDKAMQEPIRKAQQTLGEQLRSLFTQKSSNDGAPDERVQVWRYSEWPLAMFAYACIGWGAEEDIRDVHLIGMHVAAKTWGSRQHREATAHLQHILSKKRTTHDRLWTWDDGFSSRCALGI